MLRHLPHQELMLEGVKCHFLIVLSYLAVLRQTQLQLVIITMLLLGHMQF